MGAPSKLCCGPQAGQLMVLRRPRVGQGQTKVYLQAFTSLHEGNACRPGHSILGFCLGALCILQLPNSRPRSAGSPHLNLAVTARVTWVLSSLVLSLLCRSWNALY